MRNGTYRIFLHSDYKNTGDLECIQTFGNHIAMHGWKSFPSAVQKFQNGKGEKKSLLFLMLQNAGTMLDSPEEHVARTRKLLKKSRIRQVLWRTLDVSCIRYGGIGLISNIFFDNDRYISFRFYFLLFCLSKNNKHVYLSCWCSYFHVFHDRSRKMFQTMRFCVIFDRLTRLYLS